MIQILEILIMIRAPLPLAMLDLKTSQLPVLLCLMLELVSSLCAFRQTLDLELLGSLQESGQLFLGHVHLVA